MTITTIAEAFARYHAAVIPADAPRIQIDECRRAFYAGVYGLLQTMKGGIADPSTSEEEGIIALENIDAECVAFAATLTNTPATDEVPAEFAAAIFGADIEPWQLDVRRDTRLALQPDHRYTTADPDHIKPLLRELGANIDEKLPEGWGFNLLLFTFGEGGNLFYIANADRADVIKMMREWISRQIQ